MYQLLLAFVDRRSYKTRNDQLTGKLVELAERQIQGVSEAACY